VTGREAMGLRAIREELAEANALWDGPGGVALMWSDEEGKPRCASVVCADAFDLEPVVHIPGDDRSFPLEAYARALACSQVKEHP
jgi:hypothetical protein